MNGSGKQPRSGIPEHASHVQAEDRLEFWGTGDSQGVPRIYCDCGVCREARESGRNRRYRSSVRIACGGQDLLIDCGPDYRHQMERAGLRRMPRILITHAHHDHIAGLPEYYDGCRWTDLRGQVAAPADVLQTIRERYPWLEGRIDYQPLPAIYRWQEWDMRHWPVNHGFNGWSYAFRFDRRRESLPDSAASAGLSSNPSAGPAVHSWAYCPDSIALTPEQKAPLQGLDLLVLGTAFYREPYPQAGRSVYDMVEALELLRELHPRQTWFTHLSHDIDLRRGYDLPPDVRIAETGGEVPLRRDCI